jgi:type I restriction enzyme M protein
VLFFQKGSPTNPNQDKGCTTATWVYDMRTNMNTFGKRRLLTDAHFNDFINAFGSDSNGQSLRAEGVWQQLGEIDTSVDATEKVTEKDSVEANEASSEKAQLGVESVETARFRKFSRDYIRDQKGDSLDISWLKDLAATSSENLPEPEILAGEAMAELTEAMSEIYQLMLSLGADDVAEGQKLLLAESFGLQDKPADKAEQQTATETN